MDHGCALCQTSRTQCLKKKPGNLNEPMRDLRIYTSILANGLSRIIIGLLNIVVVPIYMRFLGMEAYGLVGLFMIIQNFLIVFDLGLSSTLTRSLSRHTIDKELSQESRDLSRTLELIYWGIAIIAGLTIAMLSPVIASHWIKRESLSEHQVFTSLWIMSVAIVFQFPVNFYTSGLVGLQRQVEQSLINVVLWTVRCLGVLFVLARTNDRLTAFFSWQAAVSVITVLCMRETFWQFLPRTSKKTKFSKDLLKSVWHFALSVSVFSVLLLIFNNLDKIILSGRLPLTDYGYYIAAWQIAVVLYLLYMPIYTAYFPVFTQLYASHDDVALRRAFHRASQLMAVFIIPVVMVISAFAPEVLNLWTHKPDVVAHSTPLVRIFMPGALVGALFFIPWAIEQARGQVKRILIFPIAGVVLLVPNLVAMSWLYGSSGGAIAWMTTNIVLMTSLSCFVIQRALKGELLKWIVSDTMIPFTACFSVTLLLRNLWPANLSAIYTAVGLFLAWLIATATAAVFSPLLLSKYARLTGYARR